MQTDYDTIIVGGGLVGSAIACGVGASGSNLLVLDGGDLDFRASRGNFGLVWVQGKGADFAPYARLSAHAARLWPDFANRLVDETGIDVGLQQTGGYDICLNEDDWHEREREMRQVSAHTDGKFEYRMLDHDELRRHIPEIGPAVLGASYSPADGHADPLALLHALQRQMLRLGAEYRANTLVSSIVPGDGRFEVSTADARFECRRVVCCAGLDNERLCRPLDLVIPLRPLRGQLLITERVASFLPAPTLQVRQTREGTLQIGDSHEDVGYDTGTTIDVITRLAARAVRIFPHLRDLRLQRAWGALRIMTPDGAPVYQQSPTYPGAYAVSCHSGVTLAALHAEEIGRWICSGDEPDYLGAFSATRFDVTPARRQSA